MTTGNALTPPYDFAARLADLTCAWDDQMRPIAAEILGEIAAIAETRDRYREALEVCADWRNAEETARTIAAKALR